PQPVLDRLWGRRYISIRTPSRAQTDPACGNCAALFLSARTMCRTRRHGDARPPCGAPGRGTCTGTTRAHRGAHARSNPAVPVRLGTVAQAVRYAEKQFVPL